jgi:hypothetical protein
MGGLGAVGLIALAVPNLALFRHWVRRLRAKKLTPGANAHEVEAS